MVLWAGPTTVRIGDASGSVLLAHGGVLEVTPAGQVVVASVGTGVTLVANGQRLHNPGRNATILWSGRSPRAKRTARICWHKRRPPRR